MQPVYKVVLMGNTQSGKTSLVRRMNGEGFSEKVKSTDKAQKFTINVKLAADDVSVTLEVMDLPGRAMFQALNRVYYRDCHAALITYDVT